MATKFVVTKQFTDGSLKGLTVRETTSVAFRAGEVVKPGGWTGPGYVVVAVEAVA